MNDDPSHTPERSGPQPDLPAGDFSAWLRTARREQLEPGDADVPCGECNACCRSHYFIHVGPGDVAARRRIPQALLFPAPRMPRGHRILGHDASGCCPMLKAGACSIYADRPQTCRSYDCRVFAAAGILAGDADKERVNERVRRWRFAYPGERDRAEHAAVRAAAAFVAEHAGEFPDGFVPGNPAWRALLAIKVYDVFVDGPGSTESAGRGAGVREIVNAVVARLESFEAGKS